MPDITDEITIVVATEEDWPAFSAVMETAFHSAPDAEVNAAERLIFDPARALLARRGGEAVGTAAVLTRTLAVPGAVIPAGHVSQVAVAATARRQGLLTRFMRLLYDDMLAAGESIAVLWASEGRIYQRFGYGLASRRMRLAIDAREVRLLPDAPSGGRLRDGAAADLRPALEKIYEQEYGQRPGWSQRLSPHWDHNLADPPGWRRGGAPLRAVVHEGPDGVDGYALWRARETWSDGGPSGEVNIKELVATTPAAYVEMWRFLIGMDLTRTTNLWIGATDEPLLYLVDEPRRLGTGIGDGLWVRVLDVPAALAARRYAAPVDVVLEVTDDALPANAGRWHLRGGLDGAECVATTAAADLACPIRALGALYLGGTQLRALCDAGLVHELTPGAVARAAAGFGWHRSPSAIEIF